MMGDREAAGDYPAGPYPRVIARPARCARFSSARAKRKHAAIG